MRQRRVKRTNRKPSFFWQGVLILAPMLVLAKLGALALAQDRRMAGHEAELRAQDIAEEAAQAVWDELQKPEAPSAKTILMFRGPLKGRITIQRVSSVNSVAALALNFPPGTFTKRLDLDRAGRLVFPMPYESAPAPRPLDARELSDVQRAAWDTARTKEADAAGSESLARDTAESFRLFLASSPPTNFVAVARFARGNLLAEAKDFAAAILEFGLVTNDFPNAFTEAGLPLDVLARIKMFEAQRRSGVLRREDEIQAAGDELLQYLIQHPSVLTPEILRRGLSVGREQLLSEGLRKNAEPLWLEHEQARRFYAAARSQLAHTAPSGILSTTNSPAFAPPSGPGIPSIF